MRKGLISLLFLTGFRLAFAESTSEISPLSFDRLLPLTQDERANVGLDACDSIVRNHCLFMGYLANEHEFESAMKDLAVDETRELAAFTRAFFWLEYGSARVPRRFEPMPEAECWQVVRTLTQSSDGVVRSLAFAAEARRSASDDEVLFQEKVDAFNALVDLAPETQLTHSVANDLTIDCLNKSQPFGEFVVSHDWTDDARIILMNTAMGQLSERNGPSIEHVLDRLSANDDLHSVMSHVRYVESAASLRDLENEPPSAEAAFALLAASARLEQWDRARELLEAAVHASVPLRDYLDTFNKVGMACATESADKDAIFAFRAIALAVPETQAAAFALEHIAHLDQTSTQEQE